MTEKTFTEADVRRIVDEALARQSTANAADPRRAELALARVTRDNNVLDMMRVRRMTPEERRHHVRDQDLVQDAMMDIQPILDARVLVAAAKKAKQPIDPEILALSRQDETRFNTVKIECLAAQAHVGDGRKIRRGDVVMCHPALAELLEGRGAVRRIEESNETEQPRSAVVRPIR